MRTLKKVICSAAALSLLASGCSAAKETTETTASAAASAAVTTTLSQIDPAKWQYNSDDDVYYQLGISYCEKPADSSYETLAVFVPGAYFTGTANSDGTYTVKLNTEAKVGSYTAATAPIVMFSASDYRLFLLGINVNT